jgi:DNA-binding ferritin-like protein
MAEQPRNLLRRDSEPIKKLSRPSTEQAAKPQPTADAGVGGSSLDNMTAACSTEMMNAAVSFHRLHLKIKGDGSYAAHKALGNFYDGLHGYADTLVEGYQGATEKLLAYKDMPIRTLDTVADAVAYLRDMYNSVNKLQGMMPYSEIVNNLDLVKDAINSAKYKLLFLK